MRFSNKTCLVTGAGSGIGRATAVRMAAEGGQVVVADLHLATAQQTVDEITAAKGQAVAVEVDVGNSAQVQAAIAKAVQSYGKIDVIVNDAGMMTFTPIVDISETDFFRVINTNLGSVFYFAKYGVPHMPPGSNIVNISSVHAHETTANVVPYASSKGAIEAFTRGFSIELESRKIRINSVAPGAVDTPMLWNNPNVKSGAEKIEGAVGKPEDLAAAICFIASDEARFVNGTTLVVDGGRLDIL
ncbi:MAG TPA: SDR family oxidoreductase [Candidatus Baltobacteraceae bacterium]|jgi:NAD(P)-dependent dehydrogenase (short-subunit alcohol dehydrogenase family)|nr:SDR family oxidoreductase [Candidatus Baltobacteraceae bacterium]